MERNSAACVMEWSIELEKTLRSKKPGRSLEAISEIGLKLRRLSRELPEYYLVNYHMFGLIPGEDKLFSNTIILRLANAFEYGDKHTRRALEFLGRVTVVFDGEDVEDRALALGLFGCWAHFAKECSSIRYLPSIRLTGARLFAKIGFSHSIANNAYKTGVKLLLGCSDEGYHVAMLVSLSKFASRSTILISKHVDLLLLFLNKEKAVLLQGTALRCLHYIFCKGMYHLPLSTSLVSALFRMLDEPQHQSTMLFQALLTLPKMILRMMPKLPLNVFHSFKPLSIAGNASSSSITSESMLAVSVLVDMSRRLEGSTEMESLVHSESLLPSRVILLIIDRITLMVKPVLDLCQIDSAVFQQVNFLFNLLTLLIREYPDLHVLVLDQIFVLVKCILLCMLQRKQMPRFMSVDLKAQKSSVIRSKLVFSIYRFLVTFLENLSETGTISTEVFDKVKILVEHVCQSNLVECYTYTIYSLLLQYKIICGHLVNESEGSCELGHMQHVREPGALGLLYILVQLVRKVHSDSCYYWLKSLVQYDYGESKRELLLLPKQGSVPSNQGGLRLLLDILMKWMQIPFLAPKYFFKLRPCLGSELFAVNEAGNRDGISVLFGFHLSLNLCIQLRNVQSPDFPVQFNKLYCMLYCKVSFLEPRVSGENKEQELGKSNKRGRGSDDGEFANLFVCFELNDRGQGYSSRLLDVSGFRVGGYRIQWHSCSIDSQGECWTLPPLNPGPVFTVQSL
ncbi:hypothetical protein M0R45_015727 [Rubus argutus]|uniref:Integrator complex subunit 7-like C-terminal domain-containing protein n=1 Tax=Rubus argutus TaxID=59490 RepID=A0AAW1XRD4_RUBAR